MRSKSNTSTKLVSYTYDAWGVLLDVTYHNGGESTKAADNPFTYRGYYYDKDLNLYRLGTRYYDARMGRFINADSALYHSMLGYNLFAYCNNNPVNLYDPTGESALALTSALALILCVIDGPLPFGDIAGAALMIVKIAAVAKKATDLAEVVGDAIDIYDDAVASFDDSKVQKTDKYNPNPYGRPGEKKQNRENRNKSRTKDSWTPRNNRRDGKPAMPKSHTPSKKGHKKYFNLEAEIDIF